MHEAVKWVKFDLAAFLSRPEVQMMTNEELGALIRLWGAQWTCGSVTPKQIEALLGSASKQPKHCFEELANPEGVHSGALVDPWLAGLIRESVECQKSKSLAGMRGGQRSVEKRRTLNGSAQPRSTASKHRSTASKQPKPLQDSTVQDSTEQDTTEQDKPSRARARAERAGPSAEVIRHFQARYLETYQTPYAFQGGKDGAAVKRLLDYGKTAQPDNPAAEAMLRIDRAFQDPWLVGERKVTLTVVVGEWNRLNGAEVRTDSVAKSVAAGKRWLQSQVQSQEESF